MERGGARYSYGTMSGKPRKQPSRAASPSRATVAVGVAGLLVLGSIGVAFRAHAGRSMVELAVDEPADTVSQNYCKGDVCVMASNGYERGLGRPIANGLFDGIILELYQETSLEVNAQTCELHATEGLVIVSNSGCAYQVMATRVGTYKLRAATAALPVDFELTAKYVRREVRDLERDDLNRFLDAIAVTHAVSDNVGIRMYGERYRSSAWFAKEHLKWSAERGCDHWHGNSGFVNMHMSFTLRFEHSLQAVDPRTCVHYWDFTIDEATRDCCWSDSILWSPDWFSTISPNNTEHVVDHGRFAFLRVDKVDVRTEHYHNAYGMLTTPWNTNPTPFVTRCQKLFGLPNYVNIPDFGCSAFRSTYLEATTGVSGNDYETVLYAVSNTLHSPVHGMIGGYWNFDPELKAEEDTLNAFLYNVSSATNAIQKKLWRKGYIECPLYCADDTPAVNCTCALAHERIDKHYPNLTTYELLNMSGAIDQYETMSGGVYAEDYQYNSSIWDLVLRQIVNGGHSGTADNDGSPLDPIFWIIHGMHERYMQMVRFLNETGHYPFNQEYLQSKETTQGVFEWLELGNLDDFPTFNSTATCYGHGGHDLIMYPWLLENQEREYLTNIEYYEMTAAFSPYLPYVYDQLLNWTECGWVFGESDVFG